MADSTSSIAGKNLGDSNSAKDPVKKAVEGQQAGSARAGKRLQTSAPAANDSAGDSLTKVMNNVGQERKVSVTYLFTGVSAFLTGNEKLLAFGIDMNAANELNEEMDLY